MQVTIQSNRELRRESRAYGIPAAEPGRGTTALPWSRSATLCYFALAILGFSFWFFAAVPLATHRESYFWLASVGTESFAKAFSVISVTYRPLAQGTTWLAFRTLDPAIFPTSIIRQTILQCIVYTLFVLGWWFVYSAAVQKRTLALVACITGGVFFSGYVHLFHLYGLFYVPVILIIGLLLRSYGKGTFSNHEVGFAVGALILGLWHPFATAMFLGFYFGYYLETFRERSKKQHLRALLLMALEALAIGTLVFLFSRSDAHMSVHTRIVGFLVSYRTNEANMLASVVAYLLAAITVLTTPIARPWRLALLAVMSGLGGICLVEHFPLLILWMCAVLIKLVALRKWSVLFMAVAAVLLPFGGGIGAPVFALFAIILAAYVTPIGCAQTETMLARINSGYFAAGLAAAVVIIVLIRSGVRVPIISTAARPLLAERERTYQLEHVLIWLHNSPYCAADVGFVDDAGSPINSVKSAMDRQNRPPAGLEDVHYFWNALMRCTAESSSVQPTTAVITFGGQQVAGSTEVYELPGRYAGNAMVWVRGPGK